MRLQSTPSTGKYSQTPKFPSIKTVDTVSQKNQRKIVITLLMHKVFRCQKLSETQIGCATEFIGNIRQTKTIKMWYDRYADFSGSRTFRSTKRATSRIFWERKSFEIYGDSILRLTETSVPVKWTPSTLTCFQLVLVSVQTFPKRKTVTSVMQFFSFSGICESHAKSASQKYNLPV